MTEQRRFQPADEDPLLLAGDSPGLERYRQAKARLAEMDVAEREKVLLPSMLADHGMGLVSSAFRRGIEQVQRRFGPEAYTILEKALKEGDEAINKYFKNLKQDPKDESQTEA